MLHDRNLDKPAGLLAVSIKGSDTPSALSLLVAKFKLKEQLALVVHRIDRFAARALLFAKTGPDRNALVRQLLDHTPARQYLAVLRGQSLVVLGADPAHDTAASSKVRYTIRNGKVIYSEK